jgi:hypothetical protein
MSEAPRKRHLVSRRGDRLMWVDYGSSASDRIRPTKADLRVSGPISRWIDCSSAPYGRSPQQSYEHEGQPLTTQSTWPRRARRTRPSDSRYLSIAQQELSRRTSAGISWNARVLKSHSLDLLVTSRFLQRGGLIRAGISIAALPARPKRAPEPKTQMPTATRRRLRATG